MSATSFRPEGAAADDDVDTDAAAAVPAATGAGAHPPAEPERKASASQVISMARSVGFKDIEDMHDADGALLMPLGGAEEVELFDAMRGQLAAMPNSTAIAKDAPLHFDSEEGRFWQLACLRARKYDTARAIEIYNNFLTFCQEYGIYDTNDVDAGRTQEALLKHTMRVPGGHDLQGRTITMVVAKTFFPREYGPRIVGRMIFYHVRYMFKRFPESQVRGSMLIMDMRQWSMQNFDPQVEKSLLKIMTGNIPLRQGTLVIYQAPMLIRMAVPVIKLFMKAKMAKRIKLVNSVEGLHKYMAPDQVPSAAGGDMEGPSAEEEILSLPSPEECRKGAEMSSV